MEIWNLICHCECSEAECGNLVYFMESDRYERDCFVVPPRKCICFWSLL